jgi:hypothetical protein
MDMSGYASHENKLQKHCEAIRRNKDILGHVFLFLSEQPPNASAAKEAFEELPWEDQIAIWSVSTTAGGIWETWERDAIKYGRLDATNAYAVWERRSLDCPVE